MREPSYGNPTIAQPLIPIGKESNPTTLEGARIALKLEPKCNNMTTNGMISDVKTPSQEKYQIILYVKSFKALNWPITSIVAILRSHFVINFISMNILYKT